MMKSPMMTEQHKWILLASIMIICSAINFISKDGRNDMATTIGTVVALVCIVKAIIWVL